LFKLGKTPIESYGMLQSVCGDEASSRNRVCEAFKRLKTGLRLHQDDPRSGSPSCSRNADITEKVLEMVTRGGRWALRTMADELSVNKQTIRQILREDLRKRKDLRKVRPTQTH
jgi:hypothetical protein